MVPILHTFTVLVVSVAMALAVAHALEMPGKRRLSREPGFTMEGISEPLGVALVLVLLLVTPVASTTFWLLVAAVVGLVGTQVVYWLIVHPTNKVWCGRALPQSSNTAGGQITPARMVCS